MNVKALRKYVLYILFGCLPTGTFAQTAAPWDTIFNGQNLEGWSVIGGAGKVAVEDRAFVLHRTARTREHTFVVTDRYYQDFILEVEGKRDEGFQYGIVFRAQPAPDTAHVRLYGYQVKLDHDKQRNWTGGIFNDFGTTWNWLYTLADDPRAQRAVHEAGQWDHYRIEAIGEHIKVWVNEIPTTNMKNSKYRAGQIAFKIHSLGDNVAQEKPAGWIKNIRVITSNPEKYVQPMDIPAKAVE